MDNQKQKGEGRDPITMEDLKRIANGLPNETLFPEKVEECKKILERMKDGNIPSDIFQRIPSQ